MYRDVKLSLSHPAITVTLTPTITVTPRCHLYPRYYCHSPLPGLVSDTTSSNTMAADGHLCHSREHEMRLVYQ